MNSRADRGPTIYVVDDDAAMRDSLALMLGLLGYSTALFESAEAFLRAYSDDWVGCVVADLRLPGKSGLELQAELRARGSGLPFVIVTAHGEVSSARVAFQSNAVDFLEKPFDDAELCAAIKKGLDQECQRVRRAEADSERRAKLETLTRREREVLDLVGRGLHAKEIGAALAISPRTVEVHKARLLEKLDARNMAELVRFSVAGEKPD